MRTILQNRWFSEAFREQALSKAVSYALKVRRATAKVCRWNSNDRTLSSVSSSIRMDFSPLFSLWSKTWRQCSLGVSSGLIVLSSPCVSFSRYLIMTELPLMMVMFLQDTVLEFARSLYDLKRTDYSSLTSLTQDIDRQINNLLLTIVKEMDVDPSLLADSRSPTVVRFTWTPSSISSRSDGRVFVMYF